MYLNHYQLNLMPFEIGPDPKFLWLGSKHKEAFSILRYGILESKGFIVIIGEPGTGKSTLLNATAANFGSNIRFAKISDPALSEMDFFNFAADAFEMGQSFNNKSEFLIRLAEFVKDAGDQSKKVILVIDEAQRLTSAMLEQIRIFSNVEAPGQKVVSCIFAGQTEFLDTVKQNRALAQRIFFSHIIQPLTQSETGDYMAHRLRVAGTEAAIFTAAAVQEVFRLSGGNPRLINILCDQALLSGYALDKKAIGPELIKESTESTLIPLTTQKESAADAGKQEPAKQSVSIEPAAASTRQPARGAPGKPDARAPGRKTAYWAAVALIFVLGLAANLYLNGGFRSASMSPHADSGQVQRSVQPVEPTAAAVEIDRLQAEMTKLRIQKDDAATRLKELQARFGALEKDQQELKVAKARIAELESTAASKDKDLTAAGQRLAELQKNLESSASNAAGLNGEMEAIKKENARLQGQLVEITNQQTQKENARLQSQVQALKTQEQAPPPAPATSQPQTVPSDRAGAAPDPALAIDFIIKKKSQ
jgi:type II secretory pathway predicted ATPase ExeA